MNKGYFTREIFAASNNDSSFIIAPILSCTSTSESEDLESFLPTKERSLKLTSFALRHVGYKHLQSMRSSLGRSESALD